LETQEAFTVASRDFLNRMGIDELNSNNGIMFMNGKLLEFSEEKVSLLIKIPLRHSGQLICM
jgi:UDP-glucose:glycoprotein glucosyltransferase